MSEQWPPSPYGSRPPDPVPGPTAPPPYTGPSYQQPYAGPPYQQPYAGPPYQQPPEQARGLSNTAKFWIGFVLALPALVVGMVVSGVAGSVGGSIDPVRGSDVLSTVAGLGMLAGLVAAIVVPRSRFLALGILTGGVILTVLLLGAFALLLAALFGHLHFS
jgi:hypothetical protein